MFSGTDIRDRFNHVWGQYQSGEFSAPILNTLVEKAQVQYQYNLMDSDGLDSAVSEEVQPYLLPFTVVPVNNAIDITETSALFPDFQRLITIKTKFVVNGVTYYETAKELRDDEKISPIAMGNVRYPKYDYTNTDLRIYPQNAACSEASGLYFRTPFPIDIEDATPNLPFSEKNMYGIIEQLLNEAAKNTRETGYYQVSENEIKENTNG